MKRYFLLLGIVLVTGTLMVISAGCGGSGTTTDTTAPAGNTTGTQGGAQKSASVTIENFAFVPPTITIKKGGTVTWTNKDSAVHTATADGGDFDTGDIKQDQSATLTFDKTGTFSYICTYHPNMKGTVIVE
ncbi:MAG: cupredoxin family copper-binding protein [Candidatus Aquicultor sp.]|nr:cupredoxin family copper-binding protein [Candidatus Aquicultor sp.]